MRAIVRRVLWCWLLDLGFCLHFVKQAVEVLLVVDEANALVDAGEAGRPVGFPGAALDADVGHGFLLGQAAFHDRTSALGCCGAKTMKGTRCLPSLWTARIHVKFP